jgi:hypothetical protein
VAIYNQQVAISATKISPHASTKSMKWKTHLSKRMVIIHVFGYIAIVALNLHLSMKFW